MHISFLFSVIFLIFLLVFGFSSLFFLYTQIHLFRVILGIFIGMLILDQTSARFTEEQTNERANKKNNNTTQKRTQTMRHHFTNSQQLVLFLTAVQLYTVYFEWTFLFYSVVWSKGLILRTDSQGIYAIQMRICISAFC